MTNLTCLPRYDRPLKNIFLFEVKTQPCFYYIFLDRHTDRHTARDRDRTRQDRLKDGQASSYPASRPTSRPARGSLEAPKPCPGKPKRGLNPKEAERLNSHRPASAEGREPERRFRPPRPSIYNITTMKSTFSLLDRLQRDARPRP